MTDFSALGFNPAPGDLASVEALAADLDATAHHLGEAHDLLADIANTSGFWEGQASSEASQKLGKLPEYLQNGHLSLSKASTTLTSWATQLESFQNLANRYEAQAEDLRTRQSNAESAVGTARQNPDLKLAGTTYATAAEAQSAQSRVDTATVALNEKISALNTVNDELNHLIGQAQALLSEHDSVAGDLAKQLHDATNGYAPPEPGFWSRVAGAFESLGQGIADAADWVKNNLGNILNVASAVCGIIAIFCPVFAPIAIALSAAALLKQGTDMGVSGLWPLSVSKIGNYLTLAGDALGAVPGVQAVAKEADGAVDTIRAANGVSATLKAGLAETKTVAGNVVTTLKVSQGGDGAVNTLITKGTKWVTTALKAEKHANDVARITQIGVSGGATGVGSYSTWGGANTTTTNVTSWTSGGVGDSLGLISLLGSHGGAKG